MPIPTDPASMTPEEFNNLKRQAALMLHRPREAEDLTVFTLLDQARELGIGNMIKKGFVVMECNDLADVPTHELLTITDPVLSEAVKKAVTRGLEDDAVDRRETVQADVAGE